VLAVQQYAEFGLEESCGGGETASRQRRSDICLAGSRSRVTGVLSRMASTALADVMGHARGEGREHVERAGTHSLSASSGGIPACTLGFNSLGIRAEKSRYHLVQNEVASG